jgi:hypothetical protein
LPQVKYDAVNQKFTGKGNLEVHRQGEPRGTSGTERYGTKGEIGLLRYFLINGQISTRYSRPYSVGCLLDGRWTAPSFVACLEQELGRPLAPRQGQRTRSESAFAISQ